MKKTRKMLSDWEAPYIQSLIRLIETQSKETLSHWAVDYSSKVLLPIWNEYFPNDSRPGEALEAANEWWDGKIKLPQAKGIILKCHEAAREAEGSPATQAAARAIGQSASTIHSVRHCVGLAFYGALAVVYHQNGTDLLWEEIEKLAAEECERMENTLRAVSVENEPNPAKIDWKC